jgi:hypothetical protein
MVKQVHPNVTVREQEDRIEVIVTKFGWRGRVMLPKNADPAKRHTTYRTEIVTTENRQ